MILLLSKLSADANDVCICASVSKLVTLGNVCGKYAHGALKLRQAGVENSAVSWLRHVVERGRFFSWSRHYFFS